MAEVWYDFNGGAGSGTSINDTRNTWATPSNGDTVLFKPGQRWTRASQVSFGAVTGLTLKPWPTFYDGTAPAKPIITHSAASTFTWNFQGDGVHTVQDLSFEDCSSNAFGAMLGCGTVAATSVGAQLALYRVDFKGIAHNAVRMSATGAAASPTFFALECTWDDIGEDAIYGGAIDYRVIGGRMTRLSQRTTTGDGVGFLDATPTLVLIRGLYVDHSDVDAKHCIIIDVPTAGTGLAIIEDCTLIGYSGGPAESHTVFNGDCVIHSRRNRIITHGIGMNLAGAGSTSKSDLIIARNVRASSDLAVAIQANNCAVSNMTCVADYARASSHSGVVFAVGTTGGSVRNSALQGFSTGIRTAAAAATITVQNNAMSDVDLAYSAASGTVTDAGLYEGNLGWSADHIPLSGSHLLSGGADLGPIRDIRGLQSRKHIGAYGAARLKV